MKNLSLVKVNLKNEFEMGTRVRKGNEFIRFFFYKEILDIEKRGRETLRTVSEP